MIEDPDNLVLKLLREIRAEIMAMKADIVDLRVRVDETNARLAAIERPLQTVIRIGLQTTEELAGARAELHGRIDRMDDDVRSIRHRVDQLEARP